MKKLGAIAFTALLWSSFPVAAHADHEYGRCYDYECSEQEYEQWNNDQRNHNRRNRGAFSPGPFDDSPVDAFNGNTVCLPGSTCNVEDRQPNEPPPNEGDPSGPQ